LKPAKRATAAMIVPADSVVGVSFRAVVGSKYDERVIGKAIICESLQDLTYNVVRLHDVIAIPACLRLPAKLGDGHNRRVRRVERNVQEEGTRFASLFANPLDGPPGKLRYDGV